VILTLSAFLTDLVDGSTSPRYGLSGRCSPRDDRGSRPCWCVSPSPPAHNWSNPDQIYFGSRLFCLGGVCSILAGFNLTSQFNCQAWLDSVYVRCLPSVSLLVGLTNPSGLLLPIIYAQFFTHPASNVRDGPSLINQPALPAMYDRIAIWERRPVMSIVLTAVWLTNVAFLIHGARLFAADSLQRFDPQVAP
jgi:hypothetical protein